MDQHSPLEWLSIQVEPRFYWSDRNQVIEVAASGIQQEWDSCPHINRWLFVSRRFDGRERWVLPKHMVWGRSHMHEATLSRGKIIGGIGLKEWRRQVGQVASSLSTYQKLVLARYLDLEVEVQSVALLGALSLCTPSCYHFLWESDGEAFIGASPERLYRRLEHEVETEALAGTAVGDEAIPREEQLWVERHLGGVMEQCCSDVQQGELQISEGVWRHWRRRMWGQLEVPESQFWQLIQPTPAVGSYPVEGGADQIRQIEGWDRGLYGGVVGLWSPEQAEFAVGIRSALLRGGRLRLFAGAGMVGTPDADREWAETHLKMRPWLRLLGVEDGVVERTLV